MDDNQIIQIESAGKDALAKLLELSAGMRSFKDAGYFEINLTEQATGNRDIFIARYEGEQAGYCILNWEPKYGYFKAHGIPETQDLNVLPAFRRRGIATAMICHCEQLARGRGKELMGISVGLHGAFGPAQVLYTRLGYIPDGHGITYDRKIVGSGEFRPVDDQLCLMMVKKLK
jgi:GNAT superfamily N-acetyltransferase